MNQIQRVTVKAVFIRDGKILLIEEPNHRWEFPGGKTEFGEHLNNALKREMEEELGLTEFKAGKVVGVWDYVFNLERVKLQFFTIAFLCETDAKDFKLSHEHIKYDWFTKEEALKLELPENTKKAIEKMEV